jgi:hypothetical protein
MVGGILRLSLGLLTAIAIAAPSLASASVLYVGDSLGVGTTPYLEERLGTGMQADVKTGRPSSVGLEVLGALIGDHHDVVVFDLGTNDDPAQPGALAANLDGAADLAADRCLVVATLNRPPLNGVSVAGLNRAVTSFAERNPNVALVDWHAAAAADPGLLTDGVHTDAAGYATRAGLFADAISSCSSFGASGVSGAPADAPPDLDDLPPAASAGSNDGQGSDRKPPRNRGEADGGPDPQLAALATELARAIATGADFG